MKLEIIFCDIYKKFTYACSNLVKENNHLLEHFKISICFDDIRNLKEKNAAFVSPANSFGSMGGGIDLIFSRNMFPWINKVVMEKISKLETRGKLKRSFDKLGKSKNKPMLPIGQAIITSLKDYEQYKTCHLITAPTMVYPQSIVGTDNPYKAFMACLQIIKDRKDITCLICPGLGTGVGGITGEESARQIFEALNDYCNSL